MQTHETIDVNVECVRVFMLNNLKCSKERCDYHVFNSISCIGIIWNHTMMRMHVRPKKSNMFEHTHTQSTVHSPICIYTFKCKGAHIHLCMAANNICSQVYEMQKISTHKIYQNETELKTFLPKTIVIMAKFSQAGI